MKTCKKFTFKNAIKLLLVLTISLSSLSLFACKQEEPTITTSVTVSTLFTISNQDGFEVTLSDENPNQTVTISSDQLVIFPEIISLYDIMRDNVKEKTKLYFYDHRVTTEEYRRIKDAVTYYVEDKNGNQKIIYERANGIANYTEISSSDVKKWDYSTRLNEQYEKHILKYKIDKSKFPEIYGEAPYEEQYLEYSLTILVENTSGDKEVEFEIPGAVQVKNINQDFELGASKYLHNARTFLYEKPSSNSDYVDINVNVIDKETKELVTNSISQNNMIYARRLADDRFIDWYLYDTFPTGMFLAKIKYKGNETYKYNVEYVYIYVYESL